MSLTISRWLLAQLATEPTSSYRNRSGEIDRPNHLGIGCERTHDAADDLARDVELAAQTRYLASVQGQSEGKTNSPGRQRSRPSRRLYQPRI